MTMTESIDFYFDFASPYGFLACRKVGDLASTVGRKVNWRPFLIGAVYKAHGGAPLAHPLKRDYVFKDVFRRAKIDGVERMQTPANFPASSVPPSRLAYWVEREAPEEMGAFVEAAYKAFWIDGRDTADPNAALEAAESLGFDRDKAMAGAKCQAVKDRLREVTETALERGVFGSPFILIDGDPFWGGDRFADIEALYG
ncbi:MAG: 2-hydroxychromene-2-carboxylate isomerase [Boseongicola sp. SB0665_bin_10]|nr:2-hydroxychromene-2-carboxylate isomerase [Boseongicola sp. SB0665_bin_10]